MTEHRPALARPLTALAAALMLVACGGESAPPSDVAEQPEAPQTLTEEAAASVDEDVSSIVDVVQRIESAASGDHRADGNAARNAYRHPVETLTFLGLEPGMTVVEIWPGGGTAWYTEVLAPVIGPDGRLIAGSYAEDSEVEYFARASKAFREKIEARPDVYDNVEIIDYGDPKSATMAEPGTADAVYLFRLYHNAIRGGSNDAIMADAFAALKPGGVLGVVQHRSPEDAPAESEQRDGYVKESKVIADAEAAGFELEARSEINANPQDDHDHPAGVWSLPPSLAVCGDVEDEAEQQVCEDEWRAIGESDRMTLKFVKPAA
jgi:predicted methyltransferase